MIAALGPIRERAKTLQQEPHVVANLLRAGAVKARAMARRTMALVRRGMGLLGAGEA
jgi:hypothetical protein